MVKRMTCYPSCMVPYVGLNPEMSVDGLLKYGDFAVARRVDRDFNTDDIKKMSDGSCIVRSDSTLREELLKRIPNFSMTMLRHNHPLQAAMLDVKMKSPEDNWKSGVVNVLKYRNRVTKPKLTYLMVYRAKQIHGQPVNYQRRFENKKDAELYQDVYEGLKKDIVAKKFTKNKFYPGVGQLVLKHSPTMLNYWHYELKLQISTGNTIENANYNPEQDKGKRNMKQSFIEYVWDNFLYKHFWVNENPCKKSIDMSHFLDSRISSAKRWFTSSMTKCMFSLVPIVSEQQACSV